MASVEDLIATMNGGIYVGHEGYEIQGLKADLARTFALHPNSISAPLSNDYYHPQSPYQHIPTSAFIPPAPASSLTSLASYTSQPGYVQGNSSYQNNNGGGGAPIGRIAPPPLVTPATSFRGWPAAIVNANTNANSQMSPSRDTQKYTQETKGESSAQGLAWASHMLLNGRPANCGTGASGGPGVTKDSDDIDIDGDGDGDFGAFEADAFAPLAARGNQRSSYISTGDGSDGFGGQSRPSSFPNANNDGGIGDSGFNESGSRRGSGIVMGGSETEDTWSAFRQVNRSNVWSNFEHRNRSGSSINNLQMSSHNLGMTLNGEEDQETVRRTQQQHIGFAGGGGVRGMDDEGDDTLMDQEDEEMEGDGFAGNGVSNKNSVGFNEDGRTMWQGRLRNR